MSAHTLLPHSASHSSLQDQIRWLCQAVRYSALAYALWTFYVITTLWLDAPRVEAHYGAWLRTDLAGIEGWQRALGYGIHLGIWLLVAGCVLATWRLFTGFLDGKIFTLEAVSLLRRLALFGLAAQIADLATRPLVTGIVTLHRPPGGRALAITFNQNDLVLLLFLMAFVALAHIFKKAAEIAADNEGFV